MEETPKTGYLRNDSISGKLVRDTKTNRIYLYNGICRLDITGPKIKRESIGRENLADYVEISSADAKKINRNLEFQMGDFMREEYQGSHFMFFKDFTLPEEIIPVIKV